MTTNKENCPDPIRRCPFDEFKMGELFNLVQNIDKTVSQIEVDAREDRKEITQIRLDMGEKADKSEVSKVRRTVARFGGTLGILSLIILTMLTFLLSKG